VSVSHAAQKSIFVHGFTGFTEYIQKEASISDR